MNHKRLIVTATAALAMSTILSTTQVEAKTTYKIKNHILVNAKTGKKVSGYQVFKNKLYKDGKVAKGYVVYGKEQNAKLYKNGVLAKGTVLKNKKLFKNGKLLKGLVKYKKLYYMNGLLANKKIDGITYKNGKRVEAPKSTVNKDKLIVADYYITWGEMWYGNRLVDMSEGIIKIGDGLMIPGDLDTDEVFYTTEHNWDGPEGTLITEYRFYKDKDGWHQDKSYLTMKQAKSQYNFAKYVIPQVEKLNVGDSFDYHYNYEYDETDHDYYFVEIVENGTDAKDVLRGTHYLTIDQYNEMLRIARLEPTTQDPKEYAKVMHEIYDTFDAYDSLIAKQIGASTSD